MISYCLRQVLNRKMETKSLYELIKSSLIDGKLPEDFSLPEENDDELVYVDGAKDGIYLFHMMPEKINDDDYQLMIEAITNANNGEYLSADELFTKLVQNNQAISIIDDLQDYIWQNKDNLKPDNLYEYALGLITSSNKKECVKLGLEILQLLNTNNDETKQIIKTLALSDEFTYYCVVMMKSWPQGNQDIFEVAKKLHGWGKIFAVEELRALDPLYEEIKKWILDEGINNDVSPSYSALTCWRNSNAGGTLYTKPTYEEFVSIRNIIDALLDEGPRQGLSALDKRKEIIMVFLNEALKMPLVTDDYEVIYHIYDYFEDIEDSLKITSLAKNILTTKEAKDIVLNSVKKGMAIDLGNFIGIDCKPYVLMSLKNDFKKYYYLCRYLVDDDNYRKQLLKIYNDNLPLKQMITIPKDSLGFGKEFFNQNVLELLMQELRNYPLEGKEFIETGLQSEPVRTRNGALTVLEHWVSKLEKPLDEILPDMHVLLMMLSSIEPVESVKEKMDNLISGNISFNNQSEPEIISQDTLDILSDAISDIGSWRWWYKNDEIVQLEFCDVQLYDYSKQEKEAHSSVIALRFIDNSFALFLDNYDDDKEKNWYDKLHDDEIESFSLDGFEFKFNDARFVNEVIDAYKNKTTIKDLIDESIVSTKYILAAKCGEVAFVAGGNTLEILNHQGILSEEEIHKAFKDWWNYWQDYWKKRNTLEAYEKDFACEASIPVKES